MIDSTLGRMYKELSFLWKDHGFRLTYLASGYEGHPGGLLVGLESKTLKLLFEWEGGSSLEEVRCRAGTRSAWFAPFDGSQGWYSFAGLLNWLEGGSSQAENEIKTDLRTLSRSLRLHMDGLLDLFKNAREIEQKLRQPVTHDASDGMNQSDPNTRHGGKQ